MSLPHDRLLQYDGRHITYPDGRVILRGDGMWTINSATKLWTAPDGQVVRDPAAWRDSRRPGGAGDAQGVIDSETLTLALLQIKERTEGDPEAYQAAVARLAALVSRRNREGGTQ